MAVHVLVVDDDPDFRVLVRAFLSRNGMEVEEATDVDDLFVALEDGSLPDVILLDLTMPGPSGWNVFPRLKARSEWANIAVVVVSGHDDQEFKAAAKERGAAGYITKPFKEWEIVDAVRSHVKLARRGDPWA